VQTTGRNDAVDPVKGGEGVSDKHGSQGAGRPRSLGLSVVIPVFNEEGNLEPLHERLHAVLSGLGLSYEILFIDDGSGDRSPEVLGKLASLDRHVRVITFAANAGQTAAFDAGFRKARGEIVVTLDADLQNDPADIPRVIDAMAQADAVCGWRVKRQDSVVRRLSSKIANAVRNSLSDETIRDTGCSLKGFRRAHLARLKLYNGLHRFLPTLLKMEGFTVAEIPVSHMPRFKGESKYGISNRVFRSFRDLLAIRWMKSRQLRYRIKSEEGGDL
jgi:glycosyltransferase involved in cell wall biosynthesis